MGQEIDEKSYFMKFGLARSIPLNVEFSRSPFRFVPNFSASPRLLGKTQMNTERRVHPQGFRNISKSYDRSELGGSCSQPSTGCLLPFVQLRFLLLRRHRRKILEWYRNKWHVLLRWKNVYSFSARRQAELGRHSICR